MTLQGVRTTGIYCRADCSARPKTSNVEPMPHGIAAMAAGYRPCLLCRPDRLPDHLPEHALTSHQPDVDHALRLIAAGYLDRATTADLAARIGISTRHLTRQFEATVGATPDFVARARRAHLARRLLDESNLSITRVAFAAGFSSTRQLNRDIKALFGFTPTQLRTKRSSRDVLDVLDGGLRLRIPTTSPYDAERMIRYLGQRAIPGVESLVTDDASRAHAYVRTFRACGHPAVIEVRPPTARTDAHLEVTMHLPTFGAIIDDVERVRRLFRTQFDATRADAHLRKDPAMRALVSRSKGVRLPGVWDPFETSIRIIVGQQVSVSGASTVTGRLVEHCGTPVDAELPHGLRAMFPDASQVATLDPAQLSMPKARAITIRAFAAAVASDKVTLDARASLDDTIAALTTLPGIGPWTAHMIAARVLQYDDAFPAQDLGLRKAAAAADGRAEPYTSKQLEHRADCWRPYRAHAAAHLWFAPTPARTLKASP